VRLGFDPEPLDRSAANDMLVEDLFHIVDAHLAVPDCFRVDDDGHTTGTVSEASGGVDADAAVEPSFSGQLLQSGPNLDGPFFGATSLGIGRIPLIYADKHMSFVRCHGLIIGHSGAEFVPVLACSFLK
jgi:hypothetical protein